MRFIPRVDSIPTFGTTVRRRALPVLLGARDLRNIEVHTWVDRIGISSVKSPLVLVKDNLPFVLVTVLTFGDSSKGFAGHDFDRMPDGCRALVPFEEIKQSHFGAFWVVPMGMIYRGRIICAEGMCHNASSLAMGHRLGIHAAIFCWLVTHDVPGPRDVCSAFVA